MKLKKITAAVCAAALAFGAAGLPAGDVFGGELAITASAADEIIAKGTCGENVKWQLDSAGTLTIGGSGEMEDYGDVSETPWYSYEKDIKKAVIKKGVTSIGDCSFAGFSLESFSIAGSVKIIGEYAFNSSGSFTEINIPEGVETIKKDAFAWNYGRNIKLSLPSTLRTLDRGVFYYTDITNAYLPEGLTYTGEYTFSKCRRLKNVTLPKTLERIGEGCFRDCGKLEKITIPNSVTRIDESAFRDTGLISVTIPDSVTETGKYVFQGCDNLKNITFSKNNKILEDTCWECNSLESVTIPEGVTKLSGTFKFCDNLSNVTLPDTLTTIGDAFKDCPRFQKITIPKSVTDISSLGYNSAGEKYTSFLMEVSCYHNTEAERYATEKGYKIIYLDGDFTPGDLNGTGEPDLKDLVLMQKIVAGWKIDKSTYNEAAADLNGDNKITVKDLIVLQKIVAGWKV